MKMKVNRYLRFKVDDIANKIKFKFDYRKITVGLYNPKMAFSSIHSVSLTLVLRSIVPQ
jgi:hypothetical protein